MIIKYPNWYEHFHGLGYDLADEGLPDRPDEPLFEGHALSLDDAGEFRRPVQPPPADAPVQIDAPDHVALFTYDNGAFVLENFRDDAARVQVMRKGQTANEAVSIAPHSFRVFTAK